jgi:S-adenosylmethionine hydrolase
LQALAPRVPVVDLFSDLPAFNVRAGAYLIPAYSQYLPAGSVCLCVVDPGVGGARQAVALQADGRWYVGPDNGLLSIVLRRAASFQAWKIVWQPKFLSSSFHGRDLFAPICARIARGESSTDWGRQIDSSQLLQPDWPNDLAEVVYIDPYGNAITGLRASCVAASAGLMLAGVACGHQRVFCEAIQGQPFWYANANGLVEIALPGGSAARLLGVDIATPVRIAC